MNRSAVGKIFSRKEPVDRNGFYTEKFCMKMSLSVYDNPVGFHSICFNGHPAVDH